MTLVSVIALTFAAAASVAPANRPANPTYMRPPAGWHSLGPPPPNAPIDYGWVPPHFRDGTPHAGKRRTGGPSRVRTVTPRATERSRVGRLTSDCNWRRLRRFRKSTRLRYSKRTFTSSVSRIVPICRLAASFRHRLTPYARKPQSDAACTQTKRRKATQTRYFLI